jgi:signal transduction histidine kinase
MDIVSVIAVRPTNPTSTLARLTWSTAPRLIFYSCPGLRLAAGGPRRSRMAAQLDKVFEMVTHVQRLAEHEKSLLARELHDELGGMLISAVMDLSILSPRVAALGEDSREKMGRLREVLHSAIEITRRITEELHPTLLDNVGVFAALRWQLKQVCARSKVNCTADAPAKELSLTPVASFALFRSAQEALLVGIERQGVTEIALAGKVDSSPRSSRSKEMARTWQMNRGPWGPSRSNPSGIEFAHSAGS